MSSETKNRPPIMCVYCGNSHENSKELMQEHMLSCNKRPEYALLVKIELLKNTGDEIVEILHSFATAIATYDGGMTGVWEIYRAEVEKWVLIKNASAHELAESMKLEDLQGEKKSN